MIGFVRLVRDATIYVFMYTWNGSTQVLRHVNFTITLGATMLEGAFVFAQVFEHAFSEEMHTCLVDLIIHTLLKNYIPQLFIKLTSQMFRRLRMLKNEKGFIYIALDACAF